MQLEVKYDAFRKRVICKDTESGIIGKMIMATSEDEAYRIMSSIDLDEVAEHVKEIKAYNGKENKK